MSERLWKVGELAARTGLTVRTLHHYDAIGLLSPSARTGSAHRLYTAVDLGRLQQIVSLKALGFSLEQIGEYLAREDYDPREVIRLHLRRVKDQAEELNRIAARLTALARALETAETVSADEFLITIQEMTMVDKYYTPEQLATLQARKAEVGEERIQEVEAEWPRLMAEVRAEMEAGTDPADPKVQALARRWSDLVSEFTGGDPGIERSLTTMYQNEDQIHGMDVAAMRPMYEYIGKAATAAGIRMPGT